MPHNRAERQNSASWSLMGKSGFLIVLILGALLVAVVFLPQLRQWWLKHQADEVTVTYPAAHGAGAGPGTLDLKIISVLGKAGIPAILNPEFLDAGAATGLLRLLVRLERLSSRYGVVRGRGFFELTGRLTAGLLKSSRIAMPAAG